MSSAVGVGAFTMRELLGDLKDNDYQEPEDSDSTPGNNLEFEMSKSNLHDSQNKPEHLQRHETNNDVTMELINSVIGVDEESRSRQRILTFAAKRYAVAIESNPEDHDSLYNWALVLQESADNVDAASPSRDALLEEACKKYDEATRICPALHDAFYNWAIAISDRAKMRGRTKEAEELWKQATRCYERAVGLSWNSPQALNNWGLALQELSAIVPAREKQGIVRDAISKFRSAIQLQFDFHRAIYNLGTVLYGLAEDRVRRREASQNDAYSQSAIYIAVAHSLRPGYSVYHSALKLVRSMLPLPYLKVGYLSAPPAGKAVAPHGDWRRCRFFLDHEGLFQQQQHQEEQEKERKVGVEDMASAAACADLTLPPSPALRIDTVHPSSPLFLVADSWDTVDQWLDALRLVYTIYARGNRHILAALLVG